MSNKRNSNKSSATIIYSASNKERPSDLECAVYLGISLREYQQRAIDFRNECKKLGTSIKTKDDNEYKLLDDLNMAVKMKMDGRFPDRDNPEILP